MLIPSVKVVFEGPSSEYYARLKTIAAARMTGCARLVFSDFEGTLFYREGRTVTALQESGMWMALGPEMTPPLENKAVATKGTMAIYELTPAMLNLFEGRKISTVVETDLGAMVNAGMLIDNLHNSASTCILKVRGQVWTGYIFMASGKTAGASYVSENDRHYGDKAIDLIKKATGKAAAAIYFLEGGAPITEVAPPVAEKPVAKQAGPAKPKEEAKPAAPVKPVEAAKPAEEKPKAVQAPAPVAPQVAVPAPAIPAAARQVELKVATSSEVNLKHESRIVTLEELDARKIVLVDESVLKTLQVKEADVVSLVLPGNRTEKVTVSRVDVQPGTSGTLILPKKLRRKLSIKPGSTIVIRA